MASKPLEGIRVLDLSELLPGPYATHLLRELGADIVKVERAGGGDNARVIVPGVCDVMNRGKSSICLNLRNEAAREVFYRMAKDADVVIEGYRPGVVKRLGIDYDTLAGINPRIICILIGPMHRCENTSRRLPIGDHRPCTHPAKRRD